MIRIASFNLENLFTRPSAMNENTDAEGSAAIEHYARANAIIAKTAYSETDKQELTDLSKIYKWHLKSPSQNALLQLQKIRGNLFLQPKTGPLQVSANRRADWVGWFELRREDIAWKATYNTGQ